ncbi:MAG: M36 family metallopeptidase [Chitinophagales bacterium]
MIKRILPIILVLLVGVTFSKESTNIVATLKQNKAVLNISDKDIDNLVLESSFTDESTGITHYYYSQTYNGIKLYNSQLSVHMKDGKIVYSTPSQVNDLATQATQVKSDVVTAKSAIQYSAKALDKKNIGEIKTVKKNLEYQPVENLSKYPVYTEQIYYFDDANKSLVKAWKVNVFSDDHNNVWNILIDASNGKIVEKIDQVVHCSFPKGSFKSAEDNHSNHSHTYKVINSNNATQSVANPNAGAYNVFPYTTESPTYGPRVLISNPDNATASPYGWHDTNGATGAEYTITRGNNAYAYVDADDNDSPDANSSPDGGATLTFNYSLNFNAAMNSGDNQKAAVTNLFYMNNIMHDVFYQYGFTEAAGNFQSNNYGKGGLGNDFVYAEAQDGYSLTEPNMDNANFYTSPDGVNFPFNRSRMQMYMWNGTPPSTLTYNTPSTIAGDIPHGSQSDWGPCSYNITGAVANATTADLTYPASYVCGAVNNSSEISGKIALIDRGGCDFSAKVYAVQLAGAIGAIIINRQTAGDSLIGMSGGTNAGSVTIPAVFVTYAEGQKLRDNLATATVTLVRESSNNCLDLDGSLDNGIIAHEYGHGISTRLTGGASSNTCLNNAEQMGEGWSDFFALALTKNPSDNKYTARGIGNFASGLEANGEGIRTYPYSYDMSIDPWTYADLASIEPYSDGATPVHTIGEIWASTLWDLYWNLVDQYGYDNDLYNGNGGNNIAIKLVIEGLKLQPCRPGFIDGRNAILAADSILYGKANECFIWQAFARRGMGASALQGSSSSYTDQTAAFDLPAACNLDLTANFGASKLIACVGEAISFSDSTVGSPTNWLWTFGDGTTSSSSNPTHAYASAGTYNVKLVVTNSSDADSIVKSAFITINAKPAVLASADVAICQGESTTLTASGAVSYLWTSGGTTNSENVQPSATTTYFVTGTTNGCTNIDSVIVTVKAKPVVSVNNATICSGQSVTLTASGASTYNWSTGAATTSISVSPTSTTSYKVAGSTDGCPSDSVTASYCNYNCTYYYYYE